MEIKIDDNEDLIAAYMVQDTFDKTEGRTPAYPSTICRVEATAKRLAKGQWVQGSDSPVKQILLYRINNSWYGPVSIIDPSANDKRNQEMVKAKRKARNLIRGAGFTDEEIRLANLEE